MSQSRRNFLKAVGASAGMSALYMSGSNTMALAAGDVRAMATAQNGMTGTEIFWDKLRNEFIGD